jgi:glycosyltransferase involved in cell wall biosynthesis
MLQAATNCRPNDHPQVDPTASVACRDPAKRARVCLVASWYKATAPRLFHRHARLAAQAGYDVVIVARHPRNETLENIHIIGQAEPRSRAARMLSTWRSAVAAWRTRADLYVFYDLELQPWAVLFRLLRKPVIVDIFEDNPAAMLLKRWIPGVLRRPTACLVAAWESLTARLWSGLITADPGVMRRFTWKPADRRAVVYNFPRLDQFAHTPDNEPSYDVVYVGGLSIARGILLLAKAVLQLRQRGFCCRVLLVGNFIDRHTERELFQFLNDNELAEQFTVTGPLPYAEAMARLASARIGVVPFEKGIRKYQNNIPSKMFDYWAAGLPVVVSDFHSARAFIEDGQNGIVVPAGSADKLAVALEYLLAHPREARAMGAVGRRQVVERWNADGPDNKAFLGLIAGILPSKQMRV